MRRPLLMVGLLYSAGIVLADLSPFSLPVFVLLGAAAAVALLAMGWTKARWVLLLVVLPLAGAANLAFRSSVLAPHDLRTLLGQQPALAWVRGRLVATPSARLEETRQREAWRSLSLLEVSAIQLQGHDWQPAAGRVMVGTPGLPGKDFFGGREVEIDGTLRPPRRAGAEGLFDYARYLQRQGVYYQLVVASTNDWRVAASNPSMTRPLADRFCEWAKGMLARGLPAEDEPLQLLWAMTLGWKAALTAEVSEPFMRSGTMHVFAISGLHIALISGILVAALRVFRVPRFACGGIVIPFLWIYTAFTGWQASAIRSTIMMSVIIAGWSLRRPSDLLNSLAAAACIILLLDPRQLFQASFQLSFFVVFSLALFLPVLDGIRRKILRCDPLVPDELRPRWQRWARPPLDYVSSGLTTSFAAWLGSIPLVAYYFHLFTPVSLVANVMVVPLSGLALACTMGSLFVGAWVPLAAELFNNSAWLFMWLMVRVSHWCAQLPGACLHAASPSALNFVLYYTVLFSVLAGWLTRPRLRAWMAGGLLLLASLWVWQFERGIRTTRVTVLPLNGGEAVYFRPAGSSENLLIDCGDASSFDFIVKPFLQGQGVNRLGGMLLTHGDIRNVGGALAAQATFRPEKVFLNHLSFRSAAYRQARTYFEKRPGSSQTPRRGDAIGPWQVLHPDELDAFSQADDGTFVLRAEIEGFGVLLLSDLGKSGQSALLRRYPKLRADVVFAGLPARGEPLAEALLDRLGPQAIVVTDSEYPATARASRGLQERLSVRAIPVFYTRRTGGLMVSFRAGSCRLRAANGRELSLRPRSVAGGNPRSRKWTERLD